MSVLTVLPSKELIVVLTSEVLMPMLSLNQKDADELQRKKQISKIFLVCTFYTGQ